MNTKENMPTNRVSQRVRAFLGIAVLLLLGIAALAGVYLSRKSTESRSDASFGQNQQIWFEDNNLAQAGGYPTDFKSKFSQLNQWNEALDTIDVYMIRTTTFKNPELDLNEAFLKETFFPVLKSKDIKFALDTGSATWVGCRSSETAIAADKALIARVQQAGGTVDYISMQSVLSKPLPTALQTDCPDFTLEERITGIIDYIKAIKAEHPSIKIGIIDALPTHGKEYRGPYKQLATRLQNHNLKLDYIHLDKAYEPGTPEHESFRGSQIKEVETYVKSELNIPFGLVYTSSTGGRSSAQAFSTSVLDQARGYKELGGNPDHFLLMAWYPNPAETVPESRPHTFMNVVKEFGKVIKGTTTTQQGENNRPSTVSGSGQPNSQPVSGSSEIKGNLAPLREGNVLAGWSVNVTNPSEALSVELYIDGPRNQGEFLGIIAPTVDRSDINQKFGTTGMKGFRYIVPVRFRDGQEHRVYAYAKYNESGQVKYYHLENSPTKFKINP